MIQDVGVGGVFDPVGRNERAMEQARRELFAWDGQKGRAESLAQCSRHLRSYGQGLIRVGTARVQHPEVPAPILSARP